MSFVPGTSYTKKKKKKLKTVKNTNYSTDLSGSAQRAILIV